MRLAHSSLHSSRSGPRQTLALAAAGGLVLLAASPGAAAEPVAQAEATALVLTVLDTPADSGSVRATHDGTSETVTGTRDPAIEVLGDQDFLQAGTLSQDATATVVQRDGRSAACAGLAGDGATLAEVGDGFCLTPGDNATINAGTIDLTSLQIIESELLAGLPAATQQLLQPVLDALTPGLSDGLEQALTALGDLGLVLDLGTIQSQCSAVPGTAEGDSQLLDSALSVEVNGMNVDILALPVEPGPNTKLITDLDEVVSAIVDGLTTQFATAFDGALDPLIPGVEDLEAQLNENLITSLSGQLAPLEENILDVTLNKQINPTDGSLFVDGDDAIEVTALDARVLPAASEFVDLVNLEIGRSLCGPNARVDGPPTGTPTATPSDPTNTGDPTNPGDPTPAIPTSVPAGELDAAGVSSDGAINGRIATGAVVLLTMLAAVGGTYGFRRVLRG